MSPMGADPFLPRRLSRIHPTQVIWIAWARAGEPEPDLLRESPMKHLIIATVLERVRQE